MNQTEPRNYQDESKRNAQPHIFYLPLFILMSYSATREAMLDLHISTDNQSFYTHRGAEYDVYVGTRR